MSAECFHLEQVPDLRDEPYQYDQGKTWAEVLATQLGLRYKTPLCVGVTQVWHVPEDRKLRPSPLEIAVLIERGELKRPLALTPVATCNGAKPQAYNWWRPNQTHFAAEAAQTLAATIKSLHQSLHLI